ncbi:MAG: YeeE/YedE family protein [Gammaproteobacteria bacterium]|uniref:YeeE/YedE family protein n=1 Tax=Thiomicrorhabdus cannonii TaxID=2748011 RepID=UPI0015BE2F3E|nr:YeeE/YedE thiosulfate transporter family protein [Thiomicrorhabdus cannonii]MBD3754052.1 YeeE/YedE family protein [Gammaproteobacteria bacterium]MBD3776958.1 YeeE/YedE family protein [Thiotrichales bacterium]
MEVVVWAGWLGGIAIGFFVILHFWLMGKPAGCSTGYGNVCGLICKKMQYYQQGEYSNLNNTKLWFLIGIPLGGLLSALGAPGEWHMSFDMGMYEAILPQSDAAKALWLTFGGMLLGFGARLAGACTTGHALVGGAMMNPPSLLAGAVFFISAMVTTQLLFNF